MTQTEAFVESVISEAPLRLWSVDEYHRMIEAEILTTDDQVELLEGRIVQLNPQRSPHAATTQCASDYLRELLVGKVIVRVQMPITLQPNSEPEPDVAIVHIDPRKYLNGHPQPKDIFLLIEVVESTLRTDRAQKAQIYAKAKIPEYWVIDVNQQQVYVFRQPESETYIQESLFSKDANIELVAFPEVTVALSQLSP